MKFLNDKMQVLLIAYYLNSSKTIIHSLTSLLPAQTYCSSDSQQPYYYFFELFLFILFSLAFFNLTISSFFFRHSLQVIETLEILSTPSVNLLYSLSIAMCFYFSTHKTIKEI